MNVEIYRLDHPTESYKHVTLVTVPTSEGMRGFLPHHMAFMGELAQGAIEVKGIDKTTSFKVEKGYVQFENNTCKIFVMDTLS